MNATLRGLASAVLLLAACGKEAPAPPKPDPGAECRRRIVAIMVAVQRYDDENGSYPASGVENLITTLAKKGANGKPQLEFPDGPNDPWGHPWVYVNTTDGSAPEGWSQFEAYSVYSFGPNGKDEKGEGDDVASWTLQ